MQMTYVNVSRIISVIRGEHKMRITMKQTRQRTRKVESEREWAAKTMFTLSIKEILDERR